MIAESSCSRHVQLSPLAGEPRYWLIGSLLALTWFYVFVMTIGSAALVDAANLGGPIFLGAIISITGYRLLTRHPEVIWTPYAWFLLAVVLFYSIGPLIYPLAGADVLAYALSFLPVTSEELLRTNLLDAVGVTAILLGFRFASFCVTAHVGRLAEKSAARTVGAKSTALTFLIVGGLLEFLIILPFQFDLTHIVLPGVIKNLGDLYLLGLMVLAYVVARGNRRWLPLLSVLWSLQVLVSTLVFSKHELILALALPALGAYFGHRRNKQLLFWGLVLILVYFSVGRLVLYGRDRIYMQTGNISHASLTQRLRIVQDWIVAGMPTSGKFEISAAGTGWARLNYAPEQSHAMLEYDNGYSGHTLANIGIVLIPRLLWRDKPITTDMSVDFYKLVTGRRGSHLGLGLFGEGYWDFGWWGVLGLGFVTGAIFAGISGLALGWMRKKAFEYLPSIFIGINMGVIGTTQFFVNSVFGATSFLLIYAGVTWFIIQVTVRPRYGGGYDPSVAYRPGR